jgi:nucleoside-diphosphate-sugar epimerase
MILVTGATGFLGSYLAKGLIRKGEQVRALKRAKSRFDLLGEYAQQIEWVEADLLDITTIENAVDGIEKIYHCAGVFSPNLYERENAMLTHAEGTANLFNIALDKKVKKVLHVSSTIALGLPLNGAAIDENYYSPADKLRFDYFKGKRYAELEAWRANAEGLNVVIVNPGGLLGAGYWDHQPLNMFTLVYNGLKFYTEGSNGFLDVRDASQVMIQLMEADTNGERFILISENILLKDLLNKIADALKVKPPKYKVSKTLSTLAWRYEYLRSLVLNKAPNFTADDMRIARIAFNYSNTKVINTSGYKFRPLAQTITETAMAFIDSKNKGTDFGIF